MYVRDIEVCPLHSYIETVAAYGTCKSPKRNIQHLLLRSVRQFGEQILKHTWIRCRNRFLTVLTDLTSILQYVSPHFKRSNIKFSFPVYKIDVSIVTGIRLNSIKVQDWKNRLTCNTIFYGIRYLKKALFFSFMLKLSLLFPYYFPQKFVCLNKQAPHSFW